MFLVISTPSGMPFISRMLYILFLLTVYCHIASCIRNFALKKFAQQSSTLNYNGFVWSADKAVDGITTGLNADTSKTCSATDDVFDTHTWSVQIGFIIIIKSVTVYGRSYPDQLSGFELYLGSTTNPWLTKLTSGRVKQESNIHIFEINNLAASVISVVRRDVQILTLCEVTVEGECLDGVYSEYCNNTCGWCHNGNPCDKESGMCPDGCDPGWKEIFCNVECEKGTYGRGCLDTCGLCLNGNETCSTVDGLCRMGCQDGWQGETCKKECNEGTYGHRCNNTCDNCLNGCLKTDGLCIDGCKEGWQGDRCEQERKSNILTIVVLPVVIVVIIVLVITVITVKRYRSKEKGMVANRKYQGQNLLPRMSEVGGDDEPQQEEIEEMPVSEEPVYHNTERKPQLMTQCIPVLSFWDFVRKKKANKEEYESEFQMLTRGLSKKYDAALANPLKNRYKLIYPYDFNRVVLKRCSKQCPGHINGSDYINASHIKGYKECKHYIAAQGPTKETVGDFWWMVWQEKAECIVMLTDLMEMGKVKCIQYWPEANIEVYSEVMVQILHVEPFPDYIKRHLSISVGDRARNVAQFHYMGWPDKDVPDTAWSLVGFWKAVRKIKTYGKGPMIVHCSAGVGRTGTFIALDIIYDQICETGHVSAMKNVENLREQRVNMVQTQSQYIFMHDVVADALGIGTMHIFQKQVSEVLAHLMETDEHSGMTRLQRQYNMLLHTAQDENYLQVYSNTPEFQSNTIWLPNVPGRDAYIAMKSIGDEEILALIQQHKVKFVIELDEGNATNTIFSTEDNECKIIADCKITLVDQVEFEDFERTHYSIFKDQTQKSMEITVLSLKGWKESLEVPENTKSVMTLVEAVYQLDPCPDYSNPILLCSRCDLNRCGVIYILMIEINRAHRDGEICILQTALGMIAKDRTLLPTLEQYMFLYKCLASYAVSESTYENAVSMSRKEIL